MGRKIINHPKSDVIFYCIAFPLGYFLILLLPFHLVIDGWVKTELVTPITSTVKALLIIGLCVWFIKLKLRDYSFLCIWQGSNFKYLLIPVIYPISFGLFNLSNFDGAEFQSISFWIYVISIIAKASAEEFVFRGFLLHYAIEKSVSKNSILRYSILISFLFAVMHFINLRHYNIWDVLNQVIVAFCFGVLFCGLIIKLRNIYILSFLHGTINFLFSPRNPFLETENKINEFESSKDLIINMITFSILFIPMFVIGFFILKRHKRVAP